MKNVILSIIIFLIMVIAMCLSINYLNKISLNIQNLNDKLEEYIMNEDWNKAYETSMDYTQKWEKHAKLIKIFVNHQEIDNVEMELWKLPQYVKEQTKDEALASVHLLKFLIKHISSLEKITIQNIF
ncbi:DUF4363 family protein [Clostridium sp. SYSU_GA19001]|uniref:DUF4363 family protein n=1 Tax=Clostridium caldaquaticum TaxID=2940653 RepID=UPI0020772EC4|nr:DUF4363 family protein [Clostridium caldaquaticum]